MKAIDVPIGTRIRVRERELVVTRKDPNFLGRDNMVALVESTDERWACVPCSVDMEVEVL